MLAVDDIPVNLLLVQKMLSRFNFRIRTASGGQQALDAVAAEKPDLILLDLMMPGIDGFEVIRRLRADPATADIRIVILSALNSNEDVVKGFNLGANDFIMKPIIMEKLLNSVITQMQLVEAQAK
ncbi:MAG: response regulator [Bacteroidales bacterium]|nr:response regulator [Bacteroidales bacterium]